MTIEIKVKSHKGKITKEIIELEFNGQLKMGKNFKINCEYNMNGELINYWNLYKDNYPIDYYIEIAEVLKIIKNFEGKKIKDIITKKELITEEFKINQKNFIILNNQILSIKNEYNKINSQLKKEKSILKRQDLKDKLYIIESERLKVKDKREKLKNKFNQLYEKMEEIIYIENL